MDENKKRRIKNKKNRVAKNLEKTVDDAKKLALKLGLEPGEVNYWVVNYDEVNKVAAYDGFPIRYPHWRWGMKYDKQKKQSKYTHSRIYELVSRDKPCHAYLQVSNKLSDQKAIISHVEGHADFFANNSWFQKSIEGGESMLEKNSKKIEKYMEKEGMEEVERWIDNILCIEDNINQHRGFEEINREESKEEDLSKNLEKLGISDNIRKEVFNDEWLNKQDKKEGKSFPEEPVKDLLHFLSKYGKRYDEKSGKAVEMEEWRKETIESLRQEFYYFAPQKMTKVMNEGWSIYWESIMMSEFGSTEEVIDHAELQAKVLDSRGLNPYKLGKELWKYLENKVNREEIASKLLKINGINPDNFEELDFEKIQKLILPNKPIQTLNPEALLEIENEKTDRDKIKKHLYSDRDIDEDWKFLTYKGLAERHFSLNKPENKGFLKKINKENLETIYRYLSNKKEFESIEEAINNIDYTCGWRKMKEVRETHNDVTFIDEFLTQEFVDRNNYFTYEYSKAFDQYKATSTEYKDVKKKLLLEFTNFGKPTIKIHDANYKNAGELLLIHHYNGIQLDIEKAEQTLKRIFKMWGRPINLKTVKKELKDATGTRRREIEEIEKGLLIRYDGEKIERNEINLNETKIADSDYNTKPEDW